MYFDRRYRTVILLFSFSITTVIFLNMFIQKLYFPSGPYYVPLSQKINNTFALGFILALVFPAIIELNNSRWLSGVDSNVPKLLRDVTESVSSGIPLFKALENSCEQDYGSITEELKKAMVKFKLTSDLKASLKALGSRLIRPSGKRMSTVLIEADESGGKIKEVLETSVTLFNDLSEYQKERKAQMTPYTLVVYIGTIIFLVISWVILIQFLNPLTLATSDPLLSQTNLLNSVLDINYYKSILFWAAMMEAIFGGLIAGKIREGRISAGLIHSVMLLIISVAFFNFFSV